MPEVRNEQLIRIFRLIDFLANSRYGKSVQQMHAHLADNGFNVTDRTVRRDVKALQAVFLPFIEEKNEDGAVVYRLDSNAIFKQQFIMTPRALLGLFLTRGLSTQFKSSPFYPELQDLFATIDSSLSDKARDFFQEIAQSSQFSTKLQSGHSIKTDVLSTLQAACVERQWISAVYESTQSGTRERKLGPHALYYDRGNFYLLAEDGDASQVKAFAITRFKSAEILDEAFSSPKLDPHEYFKNSLGVFKGAQPEAITLLFEKALAAHASETLWHPSQAVDMQSDGRMQMKLTVEITPDLINWIIGFGEHVTVLGPGSLKDRIYEVASTILKRYSKAG